MFEVNDGNKTILFAHKKDADNYNDYLKNGLRVVKKDSRSYTFNNGDKLINVSIPGEEKQRYVLVTRKGRRVESEKLQRKHIQAIKNSLK